MGIVKTCLWLPRRHCCRHLAQSIDLFGKQNTFNPGKTSDMGIMSHSKSITTQIHHKTRMWLQTHHVKDSSTNLIER